MYSGLGIHLPLSVNISSPWPVNLSNGLYVSVATPNIITEINEKKQVNAPKEAVTVKHLTDARKFVVTEIIRKIIISELHMNEKHAIV